MVEPALSRIYSFMRHQKKLMTQALKHDNDKKEELIGAKLRRWFEDVMMIDV